MKKITKNIILIATGSVIALLFIFSPKQASATFVDYPYTIPYTVTQTPPPVITVTLTAAPQTMTLPTNQTILTWTTTGSPDSCSAFGSWTGVKDPAGNSETMSNLAQGTYSYQILCQKAGSYNAMDTVNVTVNAGAPGVSGSLTISPNICTINNGASTCNVTGATWTTTGATSPAVINGTTSAIISTLANNATPLQVTVSYPSTTFYLKDGSTTLDSKPAFANCGPGSAWDGAACNTSSVVNGVCSASHFFCTAGTSSNNSGTGPWTWECVGSGGGRTDYCSESVSGGLPQCSDKIDNDGDGLADTDDPGCYPPTNNMSTGSYDPNDNDERDSILGGNPQCSDTIDNDGDTLIDEDDPGCHTDKDPNNAATYVPSDDDERNLKPIWIEI